MSRRLLLGGLVFFTLIMLVLVAPGAVSAEEPERTQIRIVWSPNGEWIAYFCLHAGKWRLCISDKELQRTYYSPNKVALGTLPVWSPDSLRIAYGCWYSDHPEYLIPMYDFRICVSDARFETTKAAPDIFLGE